MKLFQSEVERRGRRNHRPEWKRRESWGNKGEMGMESDSGEDTGESVGANYESEFYTSSSSIIPTGISVSVGFNEESRDGNSE
jgi:hypothetical protein